MKKSFNTDTQCIVKILRYIDDIQAILDNDNVKSFQDLSNSLSAKYAVTQLLTNVYELSRKLQDSTLQSLKGFNSPVLKKARQIASHDYDAIDFRSIYNLCLNLTGEAVRKELQECLEAIKNANVSD